MTPLPNRNRLLAAALATALVVAACGDDAEDTATDDAGAENAETGGTEEGGGSAQAIEIADGVTVTGPWARTSPANAEAGAAYFTLSSDEELVIVAATVSSDIAGSVELHETVPVEDDDEAMTDEDGAMSDEDGAMDDDSDAMSDEDGDHGGMEMAMTMREVESIVVPAGGSATLEPGGTHVMLLELTEPLEAGDTFDLTLTTEAGDELIVPIVVRDDAP